MSTLHIKFFTVSLYNHGEAKGKSSQKNHHP